MVELQKHDTDSCTCDVVTRETLYISCCLLFNNMSVLLSFQHHSIFTVLCFFNSRFPPLV